nr:copper resistance protein [uncultured Cupriavidus sp.]
MHASHHRHWIAAFLLISFLTVQLAAAAYACEGSRYVLSMTASMAGMAESCPDMATKRGHSHAGLCQAHCHQDSKSADHATPQLPVFQAASVSPVATPDLTPILGGYRLATGNPVPRPPPRPLAILHCCFRI